MKRALNLTPDPKLEAKKTCPAVEQADEVEVEEVNMEEDWHTMGSSKSK